MSSLNSVELVEALLLEAVVKDLSFVDLTAAAGAVFCHQRANSNSRPEPYSHVSIQRANIAM